jgi:thioredoxin
LFKNNIFEQKKILEMKKVIAIILLAGISNLASANDSPLAQNEGQKLEKISKKKDKEGIKFFKGTWAEALKKAEEDSMLIFLDAYASWCGPCKIMAKYTFTDDKVGHFFNKNFINYKMDMEKDPEGPRLSRKFDLQNYPTVYILDINEKIVSSEVGALDVRPFLRFGQSAFKE